MYGYTGKSLKINLTEKKIEIIETPERLCRDFIGGRGFGVALIGKKIINGYNSSEMPIIFATGPLVGTVAPTSGRSSVISKSPLTGTVFDCSVGGRFGHEMKRAGYDFIEIDGISENWVFINIDNENVTIEDAEDLLNKNVSDVRSILGKRGSDAVIGIAGEKGVSYASIVFDGHYLAGRGGLGAVMGSKRLKAIRIKGTGKINVYDIEGLKDAQKEILRLLRASQAIFGEMGLSELGTAALVDLIHARRMEPTENFKKTFYDSAPAYSGYNLKQRYYSRKTGCAGCPVMCKKVGREGEIIPEYETVSHFGALNSNSDVKTIVEANRLCNEYGLDSITTAATIACYSEIWNKKLSSQEIIDLIIKIGTAEEGLGYDLSKGSLYYARKMEKPELSMTVKGLEIPAYDPRGAYGMALAYATSNRGGCHLRAYPISHEILRKPVATDRFSFEGKARIIKIAEDMNAVIDSLTACKFVFFAATLEEFSKAISSVTGIEYTTQSLLKTGERIYLLERYLNSMNGFGIEDDDLPSRFFEEDGSSSENIRIRKLDRDQFITTREKYYRIRGCNKNGIPEKSVMIKSGLEDYL